MRRMIHENPEVTGGPTKAEVHDLQIDAMIAAGWRVVTDKEEKSDEPAVRKNGKKASDK